MEQYLKGFLKFVAFFIIFNEIFSRKWQKLRRNNRKIEMDFAQIPSAS